MINLNPESKKKMNVKLLINPYLLFLLFYLLSYVLSNPTFADRIEPLVDSKGFRILLESVLGVLLIDLAIRYDTDRTSRIKDLKCNIEKLIELTQDIKEFKKDSRARETKLESFVQVFHDITNKIRNEGIQMHDSLRSLHKRIDVLSKKK